MGEGQVDFLRTMIAVVKHYEVLIGTEYDICLGVEMYASQAANVAQQTRNMTGFDSELSRAGYLIHDRDSKAMVRFDQNGNLTRR